MINVEDLKKLFQEKLATTGSLDQAITKAVWIAYNKGREDAKDEVKLQPSDVV